MAKVSENLRMCRWVAAEPTTAQPEAHSLSLRASRLSHPLPDGRPGTLPCTASHAQTQTQTQTQASAPFFPRQACGSWPRLGCTPPTGLPPPRHGLHCGPQRWFVHPWPTGPPRNPNRRVERVREVVGGLVTMVAERLPWQAGLGVVEDEW